MTLTQKFKRIFRIYSEASLAAFMSGGVLIELICALALSRTEFAFLSKFALGAAAILMAITINLVHTIYKDLKTNPLW